MDTRDSSAAPAQSPPEQREIRECRSCYGCGQVLADVQYDDETGELAQETFTCPTCRGAGSVSVFVYPKRTERRA